MSQTVCEVPPEVPLPPPRKPEHDPERSPAHERLTVALGEASVWVAELRRRAREFARRHESALRVSIVLADGERVDVVDIEAGPGSGYLTLTPARPRPATQLIVRLDHVMRIDVATTTADAEEGFRCGRDIGFSPK
jgi:hypothetical protein